MMSFGQKLLAILAVGVLAAIALAARANTPSMDYTFTVTYDGQIGYVRPGMDYVLDHETLCPTENSGGCGVGNLWAQTTLQVGESGGSADVAPFLESNDTVERDPLIVGLDRPTHFVIDVRRVTGEVVVLWDIHPGNDVRWSQLYRGAFGPGQKLGVVRQTNGILIASVE